jgi:hypothetical protein
VRFANLTSSALGDDGSSLGVADQHHITAELVKSLVHTRNVGVKVAEWTIVLPVSGQIDRHHSMSAAATATDDSRRLRGSRTK